MLFFNCGGCFGKTVLGHNFDRLRNGVVFYCQCGRVLCTVVDGSVIIHDAYIDYVSLDPQHKHNEVALDTFTKTVSYV